MHIASVPRVVHRTKYLFKSALIGKIVCTCTLIELYRVVIKVVVTNSLEEDKVAIIIVHRIAHRHKVLVAVVLTLCIDNIAECNTVARNALTINILADIGHSLALETLYVELALRLRVSNHNKAELLLLNRVGSKGKVVLFYTLDNLLIEIGVAILNIYLVCRRNRVEDVHCICRCNHLVVAVCICSNAAKAVADRYTRNTSTLCITQSTRNLYLCSCGKGKYHKGNKGEKSLHKLSF